jgi:sporulation protein YlmC with PRC-barrel domain
MRDVKLGLAGAAMLAVAALTGPSFAQSTTSQTPAPSEKTPPASTATPAPSTTPAAPAPSLTPKDLQGLDVFGSEGQQLGKVAKVNVAPDGKVKGVEVQSGGFLGFFSTTYVVPVEKLNKKAGRIELSMTSEQAKQLAR